MLILVYHNPYLNMPLSTTFGTHASRDKWTFVVLKAVKDVLRLAILLDGIETE